MAKRNSFADKLERRARRAIFWHSLWRWESAVILALTLVISAFLAMSALVGLFPWLATYIALGVGFLAELLIFVSSLTDAEDNAQVVAAVLRDEYNPKRLRSLKLQAQLNKALEYRGLITNTARRTREGVLRDRLARATEPVDDWLQTLRNTIADKERQWEYLSKLQNTMENAEYQMESTLAALGTVYAQLQTLDLRGAEKGHADRLRQEIDEQVAQLQDLSEAMDEVYQAGS
ncbi:MAG: hypothetical protein P8186_12170 [Anaerolineae bacterium]